MLAYISDCQVPEAACFAQKMSTSTHFFAPQRSHLAVAAPRKHYKILSLKKFDPERRRMAAPMPSPIRDESEPLTARKMSQMVISGTTGAFETGQNTLKSKNFRLEGDRSIPFIGFGRVVLHFPCRRVVLGCFWSIFSENP
ncbi:hypothetical protein LGN07_22260 [Burkholderia cepacia]|uniref:hypothetical protein n=1 Tax=Burkholderia cepacia TaxID=292 RepID=UPI0012D8E9DC|nr:hypothetical protein [Burkholderia cepacia]MCA8121454.1 hypothetical protein [Burkholderia cepacia]